MSQNISIQLDNEALAQKLTSMKDGEQFNFTVTKTADGFNLDAIEPVSGGSEEDDETPEEENAEGEEGADGGNPAVVAVMAARKAKA